MITVQLTHGLGNQLFQYATGRALASRWQTDLLLDISRYDSEVTDRSFMLAPFAVWGRLAGPHEAGRHSMTKAHRVWRKVQRHVPIRYRRWIVEPHFQYFPEMARAGPNAYLEGFWQSEKYFREIRPTLLREIRPRKPAEGANALLARTIADSNSVSVHVRRGDYLHTPHLAVCSADYYRKAMELMRLREPAARFFIFSDDHPWIHDQFRQEAGVTIVNHNSEAYEDFRLMSLCRHHIIANSTFSWWPAWLSEYGGKVVIAPERWFASALDTTDLLPEGWLRL